MLARERARCRRARLGAPGASDLKFIRFEMSGEYYVHPKFLTEAKA